MRRAYSSLVMAIGLWAALGQPARAAVPLERVEFATAHGARQAWLYRSGQPRFAPPVGLVVLLHDAGSDAQQMRELTNFGFEKLAAQAGWVVVYPDGIGRTWNDCRRTPQFAAKTANINDVAFLARVIRHVRGQFHMPAGKVLVGGYSNGGHMAMRIALERPDVVDGILAIGAQLPRGTESLCDQPPRAVNALFIAGTADPIAPYGGGAARTVEGKPLGVVESVQATAEQFAARAGHKSAGVHVTLGDRDGNPRTTVESLRWASTEAALVELYTIRGGGHTIPQAGLRFPSAFGATSADIDTATVALQFMQRWPKPAAAQWQVRAGTQRAKTEACRVARPDSRLAACLRPMHPVEENDAQLVAHF